MLSKKLKRRSTIVIEHNLAETQRLEEDSKREKNWKRWGPYLSERQWGTVREDYSFDGSWYEFFIRIHVASFCLDLESDSRRECDHGVVITFMLAKM